MPTTNVRSLHKEVIKQLKDLANPQRALQQQQYMKSTMPYAGLTAGELRTMCKSVYAQYPLETSQQWQDAILQLWRDAKLREERYAAMQLLAVNKYRKKWLLPEILPLLRELVETGAWWDYVDNIASNHVGTLLREHADTIEPIMREWALDDHLWVRRTAILAQLKFRQNVDEDLLFFCLENSISDNDFFARKAIGWALREYSKYNPQAVINYVAENATRLSPLSKREACRIMIKQGIIDSIPNAR